MARLFSPAVLPGTQSFTYTSNQTVTIPVGVTNLVSVNGYGARGTTTSGAAYYDIYVTQEITYQPGYGTDYSSGPDYLGRQYASPTPADYCSGTYDAITTKRTNTCYFHYSGSDAATQTTGAAATGFTKTFAGSVGNVAQTMVSYTNVAVTAGNYNLVIPTGGTITYTYVL